MCFANAVLQLFVYCPPFWKLFRELGRLIGQRGRGEGQDSGGSATPLVDATVRFLDEFVYEEKKPLPTPQSQQQAARGKAKEEEEDKKEDGSVDSFIPTYVYDAMKEKKRFDNMRVRNRARGASFIIADLVCIGRSSGGCRRVFRILPRHTRGRVARVTRLYRPFQAYFWIQGRGPRGRVSVRRRLD